jgi:hypothetical protein
MINTIGDMTCITQTTIHNPNSNIRKKKTPALTSMNANNTKLTLLIPICIAFTGLFLANSFATEARYVRAPVDNTTAVPLPVVTDVPERQMFSLSRRSNGNSASSAHGAGERRADLSIGMSSPVSEAWETVKEEEVRTTQSPGKTSPPGDEGVRRQ